MSIEVQLKDGEGQGHVASVLQKNGWKGLAVFTEPLRTKVAKLKPFTNVDNGNNMAVAVAFGGTPVNVYDGGDNAYWTGSNISGTAFADSTFVAHTGSQSLRCNAGSTGDTFQFDQGSNLTVANYEVVTFQVYVNRRWTTGEHILFYGWDTGLGAQVGTQINIEDYFDETSYGAWQSVKIPLADLGLTGGTIDAFRMEIGTTISTAPDFSVDILAVQETGAGVRYQVRPADGTNYFAKEIRITLADNVASTVTNGTVPGLAYDAFLGASLTNGLIVRHYVDGKVNFIATFHKLSDFMAAGFEIQPISDGTNTCIALSAVFAEEIPLHRLDYFELEVNDDLSVLLEMRAFLRGSEETL